MEADMKKYKAVFVVLNYMNYDDTTECIESICENIDTDRFHIVLVDNNSPDGSGKKLAERFTRHKDVTVLLNPDNKGNSEGWNYGIRYAREHFEFDFLATPDNDTVFIEKNFCQKLEEEYKKSKFAVMGPMILGPNGRCDANPLFELPYTREKALEDIAMFEKKIKLLKHGTLSVHKKAKYIRQKLFRTKQHGAPQRRVREPGFFLKRQENVVLHGCFFIFSKTYFEHFEQFDVRSFMYAEEDILYTHVRHEGLKTVYNPEIIAYHKGEASTRKVTGNIKSKEIFRSEKSIEAIKGYISLLDELGIKDSEMDSWSR